MTEKETAFCREYLLDLNANAAARRAGYSDFTIGGRFLMRRDIADMLNLFPETRQARKKHSQGSFFDA